MNLDFHFNEWALLAQTDPQTFERWRSEIIAEFLSQSGASRHRLELLQAQIDRERELAVTPQHAIAAIARLMRESLAALAGEMTSLATNLKSFKTDPLLQSTVEVRKVAAEAAEHASSMAATSDDVALFGLGRDRR